MNYIIFKYFVLHVVVFIIESEDSLVQSKWPNSVSIKVKNNNFAFIEIFTGFEKLHV